VIPLRVAIDLRSVTEGDRGGVARFALGITEALAQRESVEVIPFAQGDIPSLSVPVQHIRAARAGAKDHVALPTLLRSVDADVLLSPANVGLPLISPCPMVLVLHDVEDWESEPDRRSGGEAARVRSAATSAVSLGRAALIATLSDHAAGMIRRRLGIAEERIRVVPPGVDQRFFEDPGEEAVERVRTSYGVIEGSTLHVGSIRSRRDLPTLVRAVSSLPGDLAPRLVLAGAGPAEESLRSMARMIGVADRLHLTGFVDEDDLPAVYRAARCVVLAGTAEGIGLPLIEAMACGTPVIAARAGALPAAVGRAGRLFPAGDAPVLAKQLRDVLGSEPERRRMSSAGHEQAARFTWERSATAVEDVLREAAGGNVRERAKAQLGGLRSLRRWLRVSPRD